MLTVRTARSATATLLVLALAGCSAQTFRAQSAPSSSPKAASPTSTPTPPPAPQEMTMEQAAVVYGSGACRVNTVGKTFNDVWQSGSGDLDRLRQAAAVSRDATSATATELDRGMWPAELQADIALVRDADFAQAAILAQIAAAPTWDAAMANEFPAQDDAGAASQRIRSRLGLPADPYAPC
ncbi:hypothetical protein [Leifsonia sp. 71-9]|uniref:hypothetical protein n=1 Tax=Leifsonia sp. 71-9 TaxID=1895934 RepID=UPI00092A563C|nr:hypothetical protein [Leifsonia sp. 71-9]OJX77558.1 MAG: hypothetical protein BGO91_10565 [Leifsonia sp. 71-9]